MTLILLDDPTFSVNPIQTKKWGDPIHIKLGVKVRENIVQLQKQFTTDKLNVQLQNT